MLYNILMNTMQRYERTKNQLVKDYKDALASNKPVALKKPTTNLFRARKQGQVAWLDVRELNHVIHIDSKTKTAEIEGMATYETIVRETLKHGFMPAVVPQLKTITLGGAMTGVGIESSSWRYGFPHETVLSIEVLTGKGEVVEATPTGKHKKLYYGFANSYGSLGYILKLKIQLVPVLPYVHVQHLSYTSANRYFADLKTISTTGKWQGKPINFVDGMMYQPEQYYITLGTMTQQAPYVSDYTYQHIYYRSITQKTEDYLTIADYIWRWDTDWFWCSDNMKAQNPIIRRLFGPNNLRSDVFMRFFNFEMRHGYMKKLGKLLHRPATEMVIQDVEIPINGCEAFEKFYTKNIGIWPAWVCPVRQLNPKARFGLYQIEPRTLYVNFGFWSSVVAKASDPHHYNKLLERKVEELGGKKSLYSDAFYDEKTFWKLYNRREYSILKKQYDPQGRLKDLYEKTVKRG